MKKHIYKSMTVVLAMFLMVACVLPFGVAAEKNTPTVTPRWSIIYIVQHDIIFFGEGDGVVSASATGQSNALRLVGEIRLFEYVDGSWRFLDSCTQTIENGSLAMELEFYAVRGRAYKTYFYVTAYSSDDAERTYSKIEDTCP